jgi:spermidine synthase
VELDAKVVDVAKAHFHFQESDTMKVIVGDGRMHLRRTRQQYDVILLDAYTADRYGSYIPYPLATREFFELAHRRLTDNGILAYNVIGDVTSRRKNLVGSIYRTLKTCFPQVAYFSAASSYNVVMIASRSSDPMTPARLQTRAEALIRSGKIQRPGFLRRARRLRTKAPASTENSPLLTDDFAPVDGMLRAE